MSQLNFEAGLGVLTRIPAREARLTVAHRSHALPQVPSTFRSFNALTTSIPNSDAGVKKVKLNKIVASASTDSVEVWFFFSPCQVVISFLCSFFDCFAP